MCKQFQLLCFLSLAIVLLTSMSDGNRLASPQISSNGKHVDITSTEEKIKANLQLAISNDTVASSVYVPEYVRDLFTAYEKRSKNNPRSGEVWSFKASRVVRETGENYDLSLTFNIHLGYNPNIGFELVFEGEKKGIGMSESTSHGKDCSIVRICNGGIKSCREGCVRHRLIKGQRKMFDIFNITALFQDWWFAQVKGKRAQSCTAIIRVTYSLFLVEASDHVVLVSHENFRPYFSSSRRILRDGSQVDDGFGQRQHENHPTVPPPSLGTRNRFCRVKKWMVSFTQLRVDQILVPRRFQGNMCTGKCPNIHNTIRNNFFLSPNFKNKVSISNHAFLKMKYMSGVYQNRGLFKELHCVPTRFSPISMLYMTNNETIVLKNLNDVVVEECGCV